MHQSLSRPMVINFAPTGAVVVRSDSEYLPITNDEIVADVAMAVGLGVTMVHLHVRDADGRQSLDPERYADLITRVREIDRELVVCVSLSGRDGSSLDDRLAPLALTGEAKPDMASLTTSSMNFARQASVNDPGVVVAMARRMIEVGVVPEFEVFDVGMVNVVKYLAERDHVVAPHYFNIMLGGVATAQSTPLDLGAILAALPDRSHWSCGGIGRGQLAATGLAAAAGGGVRVGLEDNLFMDPERTQLATNHGQLQRAHQLAEIQMRSVMTSAEFRSAMNLLPGNGEYGRPPID